MQDAEEEGEEEEEEEKEDCHEDMATDIGNRHRHWSPRVTPKTAISLSSLMITMLPPWWLHW